MKGDFYHFQSVRPSMPNERSNAPISARVAVEPALKLARTQCDPSEAMLT